MTNLRKYGNPPFTAAVIHGGPGAPGEMAPVARELSSNMGVLEPLQTKATLEDQVKELRHILKDNGALPVTLIGFSWGAMLSYIFAAHHPRFVKKLILIGSGPYEERYATKISSTRISRLGKEDWENFRALDNILNNSTAKDKNEVFCSLAKLISKADTYDPLPHKEELIGCNYRIFKSVWEDAHELRSSGKLLELGTKVTCPVVAIHGDYDPHPFEGVKEPLSGILKDFRFTLLEKCGHKPWIEREAKERFYDLLEEEIHKPGR
jgi:pimeloyl-ACP methyl ester carboxylesterase